MCKATDELTKNRRENDEGFDGGLMYEKPSPNCPVDSFKLYLSHLNPLNEFFERNERNVFTSEDIWNDNMVGGERTLGEKVKKTSREKQNFPSVTQTIQLGRQLSQSFTSQVFKQGILRT